MKMGQKVKFAACLLSLAGMGMISNVTRVDQAPGLKGADYALFADSVFAEGCMGGGPFGCMCPMLAASEFVGGFTLTPEPRVPPGHQVYEVAVTDWLVAFDDEEMEITGSGYYDRWTGLDGSSWQAMTLDLEIYGEVVHFFSGAVEDPAPGGAFPAEIQLGLESDTECFGFMIAIEAERVPLAPTQHGLDASGDNPSDWRRSR